MLCRNAAGTRQTAEPARPSRRPSRRARRRSPVRRSRVSDSAPPAAVPEHAADRGEAGEQRVLLQLEVEAVGEQRRHPGQVDPEQPAVAEVDEGQRGEPPDQRAPRRRRALARRLVAVDELLELLRPDRLVVGRPVAEPGHPDGGPDHGQGAGGEEGAAPAEPRDQPGDDQRADGVGQPAGGVHDALAEAAAVRRQPHRHRAGAGRERRALRQPEQAAGEHQPDQPADEAGQRRSRRPRSGRRCRASCGRRTGRRAARRTPA